MKFSEKLLYHQIHPAKLGTDISTSFVSLYLIWLHDIILGLIVGIIPSIIASAVIVRFANLEKYERSPFGRYIGKYMTGRIQALRGLGQIVGWFGAWYRLIAIVVIGYLMILLAWLRGKLVPTS